MMAAASRSRIIATLKRAGDELSAAEIADCLGCDHTRARAQLKHLLDAGRVRRRLENRCYLYTPARRN
nr:MAG TPA: Z DNA-binding protein [Caudoviricetes sp.]